MSKPVRAIVSVVVPTYNRGPKLAGTLASIVRNEVGGVSAAELLVVDDGSLPSAVSCLGAFEVEPPWQLRHIRQPNRGPGAARNAGFRESSGSIILFVDDDIVAPPDLVESHIRAHEHCPGSVICGRSPALDGRDTPLKRYLQALGEPTSTAEEEFVRIPLVASGNMSVERSTFDGDGGVYRDDLSVPGAEEAELSYRLANAGIPIYSASRIIAFHDQPLTLRDVCAQQFKYGLGMAEVFSRYPGIVEMKMFEGILVPWVDFGSGHRGRLARRIKIWVAGRAPRTVLYWVAFALERSLSLPRLQAAAYRAALGSHWVAGLQEGRRRYLTPATPRDPGKRV